MLDQSIAIIPARSGSQRIPKKNIKSFLGHPIISYPIKSALKSGCFSKVMVSTDSKEIGRYATSYGAEVPFLRSKKNSDNTAGTPEVIKEVISEYAKLGQFFTKICCLYPTSVFVTTSMIQQASNILDNNNIDGVATVAQYPHPIERSLSIRGKYLEYKYSQYVNSRTQDLDSNYYDVGQLYYLRTAAFEKEKSMFLKRTKAIILNPNEVQDIDTPDDWRLAELKYQHMLKVNI